MMMRRSGRLLRNVDVLDPRGLGMDSRTGLAYISDENNAVSVVNLRSGTIVRTLPGF